MVSGFKPINAKLQSVDDGCAGQETFSNHCSLNSRELTNPLGVQDQIWKRQTEIRETGGGMGVELRSTFHYFPFPVL